MDTPRPVTQAMPGGPGVPPSRPVRQPRTALLAVADDLREAGRAIASGADLIDVSGMAAAERAAIRDRYPRDCLWTGQAAGPVGAGRAAAPAGAGPSVPAAGVFDADQAATAAGHPGGATVAAVVAAAAVGTWLGVAIIRTRHVPEVRRAIDMASAIAGTRPPALTVRGLA